MIGGGLARGLVRKAIAAAAAAGAVLVVVLALGAAAFYALCMLVTPLAASLLTALVFAVISAIIAAVLLRRDSDHEDEEPMGLGERAFSLIKERPILGAVAALAGGWIFLRNPALATMVAAAFTEKSHRRDRHRW